MICNRDQPKAELERGRSAALVYPITAWGKTQSAAVSLHFWDCVLGVRDYASRVDVHDALPTLQAVGVGHRRATQTDLFEEIP